MQGNSHNISLQISHKIVHSTISQDVSASIAITVIVAVRNKILIQTKTFVFLSAPTLLSKSDNRFEKFSDIIEFNSNIDKLDTWQQLLIQHMHVNHNQYLSDLHKIAYTKSRLTIRKRAQNLMNRS